MTDEFEFWADDDGVHMGTYEGPVSNLQLVAGPSVRWYIPSWDRLDTMVFERLDADGNVVERKEGPSGW